MVSSMSHEHSPTYGEMRRRMRIAPCRFQVEAIDKYRNGKHVLVIALTGSGKTKPVFHIVASNTILVDSTSLYQPSMSSGTK